jgi:hypothetical protein
MQGSDVLATPDTLALFVVCKGTNRPGPFPGTVLAYIACLPGELRVQTCCCFLEAMAECVCCAEAPPYPPSSKSPAQGTAARASIAPAAKTGRH